jgi:hypothetical protein
VRKRKKESTQLGKPIGIDIDTMHYKQVEKWMLVAPKKVARTGTHI